MSSPFGSRAARFAAYVVDIWILLISQIGGSLLGGAVANYFLMSGPGGTPPRTMLENGVSAGMALGYLFWGLVSWFMNQGILQGMTGATVGKQIFGIRVVMRDGRPISVGLSLVRGIAQLMSALPCFLGFVWALFSTERRAWHDLACDTVVIRKHARYPLSLAQPEPIEREKPRESVLPHAA